MPFGASRAGLMSTRVDAIPDSEVSQEDLLGHYDAIASFDGGETVTTWEGLQETVDITGGDPVAVGDGIQGNTTVRFDDDVLTASISTESTPNTVFVVTEVGDTSQDGRLFGDGSVHNIRWDEGQWGIFNGGSTVRASSDDSEPLAVLTARFGTSSDSDELILRQNGEQILSGSSNGESLSELRVGETNGHPYDGDISAIIPVKTDPGQSTIEAEEQRLADRYGIQFD